MERVTGIWVDLDKAFVYHLQKGKNEFTVIESGIENFHSVGGHGNYTPAGPAQPVSEKRLLTRRKHLTKQYFEQISKHLEKSLEVVVMGPAEVKIQLSDYLAALTTKPYVLHRAVTQDSMTENQVKATIRDYYKNKIKQP
ncbi:hypothetical protein [Roseivirga echinicomitans]|uniref:Host attachment protein n=1 Tax=Roseivirga echinicomitans TaxID=296218 RepID=A0A150XUZ4_9BACT|nr:hypothetical protein [Roseivirga echinicomitans]KYG82464.1 hypothetical protein AWN68_14505 [Roseivirga echinicomitans]